MTIAADTLGAVVVEQPDVVAAATAADRERTFRRLLVNSLVSGVTSSFLWFALTFWVYLETRSVVVTGVIAGAFSISAAILGPAFGTYVDRHRKQPSMVLATTITTVAFAAATVVFVAVPGRRPAAACATRCSGCWRASRCSARSPARCAASPCRRA